MSETLYEEEKGAMFAGMSERELLVFAAKQYDTIRDRESELSVQLDTINAYERVSGWTPEQVEHLDDCEECYTEVTTTPCTRYREIVK